MPYRGRSKYLHPVNTLKHIVDTQNTVPAGTKQVITLWNSVESASSAVATEVSEGSHVSSFFINVQVVTATNAVGAINNCYFYIIGNPGGIYQAADFPEVNAVGISQLRKQVYHQEMAMLSDENDSIPITLFKGVLKVPRKFKRQGVNDRTSIVIGTPIGGPELDTCIQCIYKEIR